MQTIKEARTWAMDAFRCAGAETAILSSDLLLAFVTGRDRIYVLTHGEDILPDGAWNEYKSLVRRHAKGEPLQYLTGEREFFGLSFQVNSSVLIPRPETELLVETALDILRNSPETERMFVDVGTGSGCIAVSIAHEDPSSSGWATDISERALQVAQGNAREHRVSGRIRFVLADLLDCFCNEPVFDMILSNPPYVPLADYDTLPPGVKHYEPQGALFGGRDGLDFYRRLVPAARAKLKPGGFILLEAGAGQADRVCGRIGKEGLVLQEIRDDLQGIPRCIIARKRKE